MAAGNFHLTLRFVGEVDAPTAATVDSALRQVATPRIWLMLAGVGQFGGHTLWVGVERNPALLWLQNAIEGKLQGVASTAYARPYEPHIKLGHSRRRRSFRPFLTKHAGFRADPFEVEEFSLIESHLSERGAVHEHQADYLLLAAEESAASPVDHPRGGIGELASAGAPT
jgi:2'-5' RNA ligase